MTGGSRPTGAMRSLCSAAPGRWAAGRAVRDRQPSRPAADAQVGGTPGAFMRVRRPPAGRARPVQHRALITLGDRNRASAGGEVTASAGSAVTRCPCLISAAKPVRCDGPATVNIWPQHDGRPPSTWWLAFALRGESSLTWCKSPGSSVENVSDRGRRIRHQRPPGLPYVRLCAPRPSG